MITRALYSGIFVFFYLYSCASSRAQSIDSIPSSELNSYGRLGLKDSPHLQSRVVNVNTANVFELMTVRGLNQELAANVIHYRDKKGPFQKIEDLIKVSGISFLSFLILYCLHNFDKNLTVWIICYKFSDDCCFCTFGFYR